MVGQVSSSSLLYWLHLKVNVQHEQPRTSMFYKVTYPWAWWPWPCTTASISLPIVPKLQLWVFLLFSPSERSQADNTFGLWPEFSQPSRIWGHLHVSLLSGKWTLGFWNRISRTPVWSLTLFSSHEPALNFRVRIFSMKIRNINRRK